MVHVIVDELLHWALKMRDCYPHFSVIVVLLIWGIMTVWSGTPVQLYHSDCDNTCMVVHSVFQSHGLSIHLHSFTCALMSTCRWIAISLHLALCFADYERSVCPATPGFAKKENVSHFWILDALKRSEWLGSYAISISGSSPLLRGGQQTKLL